MRKPLSMLRFPRNALTPCPSPKGRGDHVPNTFLNRLMPHLRDPISHELGPGMPTSSTLLPRKMISWIRCSLSHFSPNSHWCRINSSGTGLLAQ